MTNKIKIYFKRHATTHWNKEKRFQGRKDSPLMPQDISEFKNLDLNSFFSKTKVYSSPLARATGSLKAIGVTEYEVEPLLIEMDFGKWEGLQRTEIKEFQNNEVSDWSGLDYKPHFGESYKDVQNRINQWLSNLSLDKTDQCFVMSHKSTLISMYALATDWDLLEPPKEIVNWNKVQSFTYKDNKLSVDTLNLNWKDL